MAVSKGKAAGVVVIAGWIINDNITGIRVGYETAIIDAVFALIQKDEHIARRLDLLESRAECISAKGVPSARARADKVVHGNAAHAGLRPACHRSGGSICRAFKSKWGFD